MLWLLLLLLIGCTPQARILQVPMMPMQKESVPILLNSTPYNFKADYDNINNIIHIEGFKDYEVPEVLQILYSINSSYLDGLRILYIINSKLSDAGRAENGLYVADSQDIYVYDDPDFRFGFLKHDILHELKHHYCWKRERYIGHQGCFLNTPIDKEYGFIK